MNQPPPGWTRRSVDEYAPAGRPPKGAIWYVDAATGGATQICFDEDEAIDRAWALQAKIDAMRRPKQLEMDFAA